MPSASYTLEGRERNDGLVRFTCEELPGFRLLLKKEVDESNYERDVKEALTSFLPLYLAAETRNRSIDVTHRGKVSDGTREQRIHLVASIAP